MITAKNSIDTIPGADDNASGISGVLETARLLSNFNMDYTIKFIAFDEEEDGLVGSLAYADSAFASCDSILGVLNLDMIGYDYGSSGIYTVGPNHVSMNLSSSYINSSYIYQIPEFPVEEVFESWGVTIIHFYKKVTKQ